MRPAEDHHPSAGRTPLKVLHLIHKDYRPMFASESNDMSVSTPKLTQLQQRILEFIESKRHLAHGVCQASRTLAEKFGVKVRAVQVALARLEALGLIKRLRDYSLKTRRRIFVADAAPEPTLFDAPEPSSVSAPECVQSAHESAPRIEVPLEPPIRSLEREITGSGDDDSAAAPALPANADQRPTPESSSLSDSSPVRKATKDEVAEAVSKAQGLFGLTAAAARAKVAIEARKAQAAFGRGLSVVLQALEVAEERSAQSWGFVVGTLRNWRDEGGAPPPKPRTMAEAEAAWEEYVTSREDELRRIYFGDPA